MQHGICHLSIIPVRSDKSHRSEQVSQLLFGETFEVIDKSGDFLKIITSHDQYQGFIQQSQSLPLSLTDYNELQNGEQALCFDLVQLLVNKQQITSIVLGSLLPWFNSRTCRMGDQEFSFEGHSKCPDQSKATGKSIVENAYMYLNAPYLWGGRSPFGIDCSGLSQMAFRLSGINIKRDAWMQAESGENVHLLDESQEGDLAFFDNEEGRITHVGIMVSKNRIIHASGQVRIDAIDHQGIFNLDTKKYSHRLRLLKRII